MPELPEVETIRRSLNECLPGLSIKNTCIYLPKIIKYPAPQEFKNNLAGSIICCVQRRGKYLRLPLSGNKTLVLHLRMTGQLRYQAADADLIKHTHVIFNLSNGYDLRYTDIRQFGTMYLAADENIDAISGIARLGWEPLQDFPLADFQSLLKNRKAAVKNLLLNQHVVAGLGNIYVDEALFAAGIHPARPACSISAGEACKLHEAIIRILEAAVQMRGTSFSDYVDGRGEQGSFQQRLTVYGKTGQACVCCGAKLQKIKIGGRSSHYCPSCQRQGPV